MPVCRGWPLDVRRWRGKIVRVLTDVHAPRRDKRHLKGLRRGDPRAMDAVFRDYQPRLLTFCRHLLGNQQEAEDVVQQTFLAAAERLPGSDHVESLGAWLFT